MCYYASKRKHCRKQTIMDQQKQQLIDRIKQAQNILVTVSMNPSVDQLAAAIGLTIALNKLDKHGTAVFSGEPPSTIDFLKPEETLEKNTDSLRDFIIALDKSKADKLRYKVEDQVVRIFITPYKTSLSDKDLDFSQGDFNVDVVVCLGVTEQQDLDAAITSHGRILHDATVVSVSTQGQGSLGTINWVDPGSSSLSEMVAGLIDGLDKKLVDGQIATALLTGIVATTDRFRNERTSPKTMSASAALMAAGANQQLIATELETPEAASAPPSADQAEPQDKVEVPAKEDAVPKTEPGTLEIDHEGAESEEPSEPEEAPEPPRPQVRVDADGQLLTDGGDSLPEISRVRGVGSDGQPTESDATEVKHERMTEPPSLSDGELTANATPETFDPPTEELTLPSVDSPLLMHNETVLAPTGDSPAAPATPTTPQLQSFQPAPTDWQPPQSSQPDPFTPDTTLSEIEQSVDSPHVHSEDTDGPATTPAAHEETVSDARSAVEAAYNSPDAPSDPLQPIAALNAQPLGPELHSETANEQPTAPAPASPFLPPSGPTAQSIIPNAGFNEPTPGSTPADDALDMPLPSNPFGPGAPTAPAGQPAQQPAPSPFTSLPGTPSAFPGAPQQGTDSTGSQTPPPPVPPPMLPPLQ